jgi:hypothetical protein
VKEVDELLKDAKVLIATPCYGGQCSTEYMLSMTKLAAMSVQYGIKIGIQTVSNESIISRARNTLVSMFLDDPEATHLMFIDADIGFDPNDVLKLILRDKDIVAGTYPQKRLNWENVKTSASLGASIEEIKRSALTYTYTKRNPDQTISTEAILDRVNLVEADLVGTGFVMIKRSVFETLQEAIEDEWYLNEHTNKKVYEFFSTGVDKINRISIGEDWLFCYQWKALGGEIWVDGSINLKHIGTHVFEA